MGRKRIFPRFAHLIVGKTVGQVGQQLSCLAIRFHLVIFGQAEHGQRREVGAATEQPGGDFNAMQIGISPHRAYGALQRFLAAQIGGLQLGRVVGVALAKDAVADRQRPLAARRPPTPGLVTGAALLVNRAFAVGDEVVVFAVFRLQMKDKVEAGAGQF